MLGNTQLDKAVGKNIWYASLGYLIPAILGYVFLFIIARIVSVETFGLVAVIGSFVTLVSAFNNVNAPAGMRRYLGMTFASGNMMQFKQFTSSAVIFVSVGAAISILLILVPQLHILAGIGIDYQYAWIIAIMIFATALNLVFYEVIVSSLSSEKLMLPLLAGSFVRFPIFFGFVYILHISTIGTIIAYASMLFTSTLFYTIYVIEIVKGAQGKTIQNFGFNIKQLLKSSGVSWVPQIISQLGSQLGTVTVFAIKGSTEAGLFYIPMTIFAIALFIVNGIERITQPLVAGMTTKEQQVEFLSRSLKIAFIFTIPLTTPLLFFAVNFLRLFGQNFYSASTMLSILIIAVPFDIINGIVYHFIYGRGDNRSVLYYGIVGNIPRMILYFVLVPMFGGNGAAWAYLSGSVTNFVLMAIVSRKHSLIIEYKKYLAITAISITIGFVLWQSHIHFIIASLIIFFGSLLAYTKIHLFTDVDLHDLCFSALPKNTAERIYPKISKFMQKIGGK